MTRCDVAEPVAVVQLLMQRVMNFAFISMAGKLFGCAIKQNLYAPRCAIEFVVVAYVLVARARCVCVCLCGFGLLCMCECGERIHFKKFHLPKRKSNTVCCPRQMFRLSWLVNRFMHRIQTHTPQITKKKMKPLIL